MSPQVEAAIIAGCFGVLTLIGTLVAQILGRRATSRDTEKTLGQQGKQLDKTLGEQREQLDRTLGEQREQLDRTLGEQRIRTLNERFATAAGQLGDDKPAAVRLAGVYAMAGLADDWPENRQTCVDVLCAYPGEDAAPAEKRLEFHGGREVRHTVIRVITAHLKDGAAVSWQGLDFDFTGVVFDGGDFIGAVFSGGTVRSGGGVSFDYAVFSGGTVDFSGAGFPRGVVSFDHAKFSGGEVRFGDAGFSGGVVSFGHAKFSGGEVSFGSFGGTEFSDGTVNFSGAEFSGSMVDFDRARFSGSRVYFDDARFSGGRVYFGHAEFSGGEVSFGGLGGAVFSGGTVNFSGARFSGGTINLTDAEFSGGAVDFSRPGDWSAPPAFPWTGTPPPGVKLPTPTGGHAT
jgi:uncharacterized protein YjbI with pentapeptide repeats